MFIKSVKLLITVLVFLSSFSALKANDVRYFIRSLDISPSGFINFNEEFDLAVKFRLKSASGFAKTRLDIKVGDLTYTPSGAGDERFSIEVSADDPSLAEVSINLDDVKVASISKATGEINYYLTDSRTQKLISKSFTFKLSENTDPSDDDSPSEEEKFNTKLFDPNQLVVIKVEDSSSLKKNIVSLNPKKFTVSIYHDTNLIPGVEKDLFDPKKTPIIKALRVFQVKDDSRTEITDEFTFIPITDTGSSPSSNKKLSIFETNERILKDAQTLQFRIDMSNFLDSLGSSVVIDPAAIKSDRSELKITGVPITVTSLATSTSSVIFLPKPSTDSSKFIVQAKDEINITGKIPNNINASGELASISFNKEGFSYQTLNKSTLFPFTAKAEKDNILINATDISFTVNLSLNQERDALISKREIYQKNVARTLEIPFSIIKKDIDNLDLDISGILKKSLSLIIVDSPRFIQTRSAKAKFRNRVKNNEVLRSLNLSFSYSNTHPRSVDPLVLEMHFLNEAGLEIDPTKVFKLANISRIIDKNTTSDNKVSHSLRFNRILKATTLDADAKPLGEEFFDLADEAAKLEIRLKRADSYLNTLGIIFDDEVNASLADTNENVLSLSL